MTVPMRNPKNMKKEMEVFRKKFWEMVEEAENIVITGHVGPDDDSIASMLAVYRLLAEKYPDKEIEIICTGKSINAFESFENFKKIQFVSDIVEVVKKGCLLIVCDGSQFDRFSFDPKKLRGLVGKTICIDHHSSPVDRFDLTLVDPLASSCAEIIYLLFHKDVKMDKKLAEIFLLGILGDTGNFAYLKPYQTKTLSIAKKLIEIGEIEIQEFQSRYRSMSIRVFVLIQELIKNTEYHKVDGWPSYQTSYLTHGFKNLEKYTSNEVSEASHIYMTHYLRMVEDHPWGFVITPQDNGVCGISLRSLPKNVSVRDLAERMSLGGGHDRAAGGTFKEKMRVEKCLKTMHKWIEKNCPVLG